MAAIYHKIPRGVDFAGNGSVEAIIPENVLSKLVMPHWRFEKSYH